MEDNEIHRALGRLESKVDILLEQNKSLHACVDAQGRDINVVRGMGLFAVFLSGLGIAWGRIFSA